MIDYTKTSINEGLKTAEVCSKEMAHRLTAAGIYPCTYYSYIKSGVGDFEIYQVVKSHEAYPLSEIYTAMTDFEANHFLYTFQYKINHVEIHRIDMKIDSLDGQIKIRRQLEYSMNEADHSCMAIIILIESGLVPSWKVVEHMEWMKIKRQNELAKRD